MTNPKPSVADKTKLSTTKSGEPTIAEAGTADYWKKAADPSHLADAGKSIPIVGKGYKTIEDSYKRFAAAEDFGDVAAASGEMLADGAGFVAGCATDLAGFVMDPVGWLVSNGLNMLLELIQPLQDALHFVTGDGPSLGEASDNFGKIGDGFVALAEDFIATGDKALVDWKEDAGNAAREALADFSVGIKGVGANSGEVAQVLKMWSMVMVVIEELIKSIISEFVSWLIYIWLPALAASIVSFGSSVAAAMSTSIAKAASVFQKITKHLGKLGKLLDKFMTFMSKWADDLVKAADKFTDAKGKVIAGAMYKGMGESAFKVAATETAQTLGKKVVDAGVKGVTGVSRGDLGKDAVHTTKAATDAVKKGIEWGKTVAKGQPGESQDNEEAKKNLEM